MVPQGYVARRANSTHRGTSHRATFRHLIPHMMKRPNGSQNDRGQTSSPEPGTTVMNGLMQHDPGNSPYPRCLCQTAHRNTAPEAVSGQLSATSTIRHAILHATHFTERPAGLNSLVPKGRLLPPDGSFGPAEWYFRLVGCLFRTQRFCKKKAHCTKQRAFTCRSAEDQRGVSTSTPPMYGLSTAGMVTEPSACW